MLKDYGCSIQVNTISLTGYYGKEVRKNAEELVDKGLIDFISSDMHHFRHVIVFCEVLKFLYVKVFLVGESLKNSLLVDMVVN